MEEEKKYGFQGTVTICSEEYRDLVHKSTKLEVELSSERSLRWKMESERDKANKELEECKKELANSVEANRLLNLAINEKDDKIRSLEETVSECSKYQEQLKMFQEFVEMDSERLVSWNDFKKIKGNI